MSNLAKIFLTAGGTLCVGLGFIGIFLPVLPTTPFLLLAAFCYARSSKRLHHWLLTNRWFGEYLKNYHEGRGMRLRHKALALIVMWASIGWTVQNAVPVWWGKLILLAIALGVSVLLLRIKTYRPMRRVDEAVE
ncbi:MAG: YbaN family protein [Pseudomonadota bacterium]|nr:YbaN family protein [Pseudomonadota bacterium]